VRFDHNDLGAMSAIVVGSDGRASANPLIVAARRWPFHSLSIKQGCLTDLLQPCNSHFHFPGFCTRPAIDIILRIVALV
jgi:hypothetical protein